MALYKVENARFFYGIRKLSHDDPNLISAEQVTWTFVNQKNGERIVTVPQDNNNDPLTNPVRALVQTIQCILSYPGASPQSSICSYLSSGIILEFTHAEILAAFCENASSIGKDKLGFGSDKIGTKSNRFAAAMVMFMDNTPVYMIMLMGRWLSDAFLKIYPPSGIRIQ